MKKYHKEDFITFRENIMIKKKYVDAGVVETSHTHGFIELVYVVGGQSVQYINGKSFEAKKGDMFFIDYNQVHSYDSQANSFSYVEILIDPKILSVEFSNVETIMAVFTTAIFNEFNFPESNFIQCVHFREEKRNEIESIINSMIFEFENKQIGYISILSGYTRVLFSLFLRMSNESSRNEKKYVNGVLPEIVEYVNQHCCEKISLNELASRCFYNPSYFSHVFKKSCGKSLSRYIKEQRIRHAIELLQTTDYSVATIGQMVGYEDKAFFHKKFKEITGKTPSAFRK